MKVGRSRLLYALGALVVGFGVLEAVLRWGAGFGDPPLAVLDDATEYRLAPSASYRRWGNVISINRYGIRGPDFEPRAAPGERRILLIGDSIVYGTHALTQEETIAYRLTSELGQMPHLVGCRPLGVAMAASSWGPVNQAAFLQAVGPLDAVAAAVIISGHDLHDVPSDPPDLVPYRLRPSLTALGDAARTVQERFWRRPAPAAERPIEDRPALTLAALQSIKDRLSASSVPLTIVYHPTTDERRGADFEERGVFRSWAADRGVTFLDLGLELPNMDGYRDSIHPDAAGAAEIATALARKLAPLITPCSD